MSEVPKNPGSMMEFAFERGADIKTPGIRSAYEERLDHYREELAAWHDMTPDELHRASPEALQQIQGNQDQIKLVS